MIQRLRTWRPASPALVKTEPGYCTKGWISTPLSMPGARRSRPWLPESRTARTPAARCCRAGSWRACALVSSGRSAGRRLRIMPQRWLRRRWPDVAPGQARDAQPSLRQQQAADQPMRITRLHAAAAVRLRGSARVVFVLPWARVRICASQLPFAGLPAGRGERVAAARRLRRLFFVGGLRLLAAAARPAPGRRSARCVRSRLMTWCLRRRAACRAGRAP